MLGEGGYRFRPMLMFSSVRMVNDRLLQQRTEQHSRWPSYYHYVKLIHISHGQCRNGENVWSKHDFYDGGSDLVVLFERCITFWLTIVLRLRHMNSSSQMNDYHFTFCFIVCHQVKEI